MAEPETTEATEETPETAEGQDATTFLDGLPEDITQHPTMAKFTSLEGLAKSYINLEGMKGDSVRIPHRDASIDEWGEVFNRLGRPETSADYAMPEVDMVEGVERDEALESAFLEHAHSIGLTQDQVSQVYGWYQGQVNELATGMASQFNSNKELAEQTLREEWGQEYDQKIRQIGWAINAFADDDAYEALEEGYGNDPRLARMLAAVGEAMTEDSVRELEGTTPSDRFGISVQEAQTELATLMNDGKSAYWDTKSPQNAAAKARAHLLNQIIHGDEVVAQSG